MRHERIEAAPKEVELSIAAPIIVKRITVEGGGHHGGAWKIAYADFMTAMMAFFLLLWLLGSTTEEQRKGLADYFTPTLVKLKEKSAGGSGFLRGSSLTDVDPYPHEMGQTGSRSLTIPRAAAGGPLEGGTREDGTAARLARLREEIARRLAGVEGGKRLARQLRVTRTPEGIRIEIIDDSDFAMFELGTSVLRPEALQLLNAVSSSLATGAEPLIIRGHTDSLPWRAGAQANNWSLSMGRAEATRAAMTRYGLAQNRFARLEGVADREPAIPADPADPRNRRISLLLLR